MEANFTEIMQTLDSRLNQLTSTTTSRHNQLQSKDNDLQNGLNQVVGRMGSAEGKLSTLPGEEFLIYE